jgi:gluconolactonase
MEKETRHLGTLGVALMLLGFVPTRPVSGAAAGAPRKTLGTIERKDPRLDALVPKDAVLEVLAEGFAWTEGPVWDKKNGRVLFSDIPANSINEWTAAGGIKLFLKPSGYSGSTPFTGREPGSNGLTYDARGALVLCQHGNRQVARLEKDGSFKTLADRYQGKRLNSPNDLAYRSNGDLYFTDPAYGLPKTFDDPGRELTFTGVYRLAQDGTLTLLVQDLLAPNGIAFSPDEKTLYVAQSHAEKAVVMAYDVQADGTVKNGRVLFDMTSWVSKDRPGLPDGLKVDRGGNLFATGPGGVHVLTAKGELLGTLATGVPTANCAFGEDGRTLFVTANTTLCRIRLTTRGTGF